MSSPCKQVDLRGQICPSTLLTALREVNAHKDALRSGGGCLVFLTDNRSSITHICDAVNSMGYHIEVTKEEGHYRVSICGKQ